MKRKIFGNKGGFTLIEVVVSMTVLALIAAPVGGALATSKRINAYADRVLQARLNVSSAAETLMAEGIGIATEPGADEGTLNAHYTELFDDVQVEVKQSTDVDKLYDVTVAAKDMENIRIETRIRAMGVDE